MKKRLFVLILCLTLAFSLMPGTALAAGEAIGVACNISGADICVGGSFANEVTDKATPVTVSASSPESVTVTLPG